MNYYLVNLKLVIIICENKKRKTLSMISLIVSILPLATLISVLLKITLSEGGSTAWVVSILFVLWWGLILSIICVRNNESRGLVNIAATVISVFWSLMMTGIVAMALFLTLIQ